MHFWYTRIVHKNPTHMPDPNLAKSLYPDRASTHYKKVENWPGKTAPWKEERSCMISSSRKLLDICSRPKGSSSWWEVIVFSSVADPDPGSGAFLTWIRDPVPFWPLDPGSGIGFFRIPDLGSRIPNPYFWELCDNFLGKKFYNSLKIGPNVFLQHFKTKIIFNFVKFAVT